MRKNNEIDVQDLINANYRITTLLGMVTGLMLDIKHNLPASYHWKFSWIEEAIEEVIYKNNPIPPMPNKDLS